MAKNVSLVLLVLAMIAIIVAVDFLFLKGRPSARLLANVGIVLVFVVIYLSFFRRS